MQTVPAEALRGKAIRLRGQVRATTGDATGGAALWLRVDRANQAMGFFDNMGNRLVRDAEWRPYAIEGTVAADAEAVAFGVMAVGGVTADFDAVELAVKGRDRRLDAGPGQGPGLRGGGRRRERTLVPYGHEHGRGVTAGRRRAPGRPVPPLHASAGRSRRRGALPGRRPDSGGARRPRPGDGPPSTGAARPDRRPGSPGPGPAGRARRAARGARRRSAVRARRPTSTSGSPTWSSPGACSATSIRTGPRRASTGRAASRRSSRPRDRPRPVRPSATRSRGWSPTCATATGSWRTPWTRGSAGSCRWRSPSSRAGWSSRRAACRPRSRSAPSS